MPRPVLEVAEIPRPRGCLAQGQRRSSEPRAVESDGSNRSLPHGGAQGAAERQWLADREAELLPLPYYHVVFTLPSAIGAIAWQNKTTV